MRRAILVLGLLVAGFGVLLVMRTEPVRRAPGRPPGAPPHVVVYLIDTLRSDHLTTYGYSRETSPVLDALASESVLFENAYAQSSWTKASVGSLLTGLLPSRHGAIRRDHRLRDDALTLAEILQAAGYRTAAFVSNPNVLPVFGFGQGFDDIFDIDSVMRSGSADRVHAAVFEYLDAFVADAGDAYRPLFLYIHTRDPHAPYAPPGEYARRFAVPAAPAPFERERALYDGEIAFADHEIAELIAQLKSKGLYEDSLVVVLSDHGEEFGDHGGSQHGRTLFEEQLRVPLIVRLPGGQRAGTRVSERVRLVDLLPTLAGLLELPPREDIDGRSFLSLLLGDGQGDYAPTLISELDLDGTAIRSLTRGHLKLIAQELPSSQAGVRLYDLSQDPGEQRDIAAAEPEAVSALRDELAQLESVVGGGTYVSFSNAARVDARHSVRGVLRAVGGVFTEVLPGLLEEGDVVRAGADGTAVEIAFTLENQPNPIQQNPPVIVDVDQVRLTLDPPEARIRLEVAVDGTALANRDVLLGTDVGVRDGPDVPEISPTDPRVLLESAALAQPVASPAPRVRVYHVPRVAASSAEVDRELDARLRALGYLGDDREQ